eukprot:gene5942-7401_t
MSHHQNISLEDMIASIDQYMAIEDEEVDGDDYDDVGDNNNNDIINADDLDAYNLPGHEIANDTLEFSDYKHIKKSNGQPYKDMDELLSTIIDNYNTTDNEKSYDDHSKDIESQLKSLPSTVVNTYFEQASSLVNLHKVIKENETVLTEIGETFKGFTEELSQLIKDMPDNHVVSLQISKALQNRLITRDEISKLIEQVVIPPDLIKNIASEDVNEDYVRNIDSLMEKIRNLDSLIPVKARFIEDIAFEIDLLKKKACRSVRDFLLKQVISLRKPRTNIQILQHSKLFKYSPLNQFIYSNSPFYANEIKSTYIETVSRTFTFYFKNYLNNLTKVFYQISFKKDVVGYVESVKGYFGSTPSKQIDANKASAFNLNVSNLPNDIWSSIRSDQVVVPEKILAQNFLRRSHILIRCLDAPLIIPHVALKNNKKYPFEQIFRSMNILLLDTVCSEYLFDSQWFAKPLVSNHETNGLIQPIFDKIFILFYENINNFVMNTYDCLGLLLSIKLNQIFNQQLRERRLDLTCLFEYYRKVDEMLWRKFTELLQRNIDSLKLAIQKDSNPVDTRPHIYTRRFSEFYASLLEIISFGEKLDENAMAWLAVLRSTMERLLIHFSQHFFDEKSKAIFLINNYDVVITVLLENNISADDEGYVRFQSLIQEQINIFVELHLLHYYRELITFIKDTESNLVNVANYFINKETLFNLVHELTQRWREILQKIQIDNMTNFTNFNLGSNITKKIISQFLIYYKRFEEIYRKALKQNPSSLDTQKVILPPISTITYEISKSYSSSF